MLRSGRWGRACRNCRGSQGNRVPMSSSARWIVAESVREQPEGAVRDKVGERMDSALDGSFFASTESQEIQVGQEDAIEPAVAS